MRSVMVAPSPQIASSTLSKLLGPFAALFEKMVGA
jgi:hypothetical protein